MSDPLEQLQHYFPQLWLQQDGQHGQIYVGHDTTGGQVTVAVLTEEAATDAGLRNAFAEAVWRHSVGSAPGRPTVYAADLHAPRAWAAVRNPPGQAGAEELILGLAAGAGGEPPGGAAAGPGVAPPPGVPPGTAPGSPYGAPGSPASPGGPYGAAPGGPASPGGPFGAPGSSVSPGGPASPGGPYGAPGSSVSPGGAPAGAAPAGMAAGPAPASPPPSHVPPPPGYQVPPPPGPVAGAGAGPTGGGRRAWPWLLAASVVVALVLAAGVALVGWSMLRDARQTSELPQAVPSPSQTTPTPTPRPEGTPDPDEPRLRPVEPVSVIGPTYGVNEETFTMSFRNWPFAFRTPLPWNCFGGEWETVPEALAWVCSGESGSQQRLHVVLWECPTTCTDEEQEEMLGTWLDEPERAVRVGDDPTAYVEIHPNEDDLYQVDLGHFGGEKPGELQWLVGVFVESPFDTRADVLKILNDIVAQATA